MLVGEGKHQPRRKSFGPAVVDGMILYPMGKAKEVFQFYRDYIRKTSDEMMSYSGFIVTPDGLQDTFLSSVEGTLHTSYDAYQRRRKKLSKSFGFVTETHDVKVVKTKCV